MKTRSRKVIIGVGLTAVVVLTLIALVPLVVAMFSSPGIKTEPIDTAGAKPATTGIDGHWEVSPRPGKNATSVGFTFYELLPGDERITSGSTQSVSGDVTIESGTVTAGQVTVDMTNIVTDLDVRDENVRRSILHTEKYPEATFALTEDASVAEMPDDGTTGTVTLTGDLTIHGETNTITQDFTVLRTGDSVIVHADVPIRRSDYNVESPDFVAAKIAEEGEINIRLNLVKRG